MSARNLVALTRPARPTGASAGSGALALGCAACLVFLLGCSLTKMKTGWDFPTGCVAGIIDNTTTRQEVENCLGTPYSKTVNSNGEVWTYSVTRSSSQGIHTPIFSYNRGGKTSKVELILNFDNQGVVRTHSYTVVGRMKRTT